MGRVSIGFIGCFCRAEDDLICLSRDIGSPLELALRDEYSLSNDANTAMYSPQIILAVPGPRWPVVQDRIEDFGHHHVDKPHSPRLPFMYHA